MLCGIQLHEVKIYLSAFTIAIAISATARDNSVTRRGQPNTVMGDNLVKHPEHIVDTEKVSMNSLLLF